MPKRLRIAFANNHAVFVTSAAPPQQFVGSSAGAIVELLSTQCQCRGHGLRPACERRRAVELLSCIVWHCCNVETQAQGSCHDTRTAVTACHRRCRHSSRRCRCGRSCAWTACRSCPPRSARRCPRCGARESRVALPSGGSAACHAVRSRRSHRSRAVRRRRRQAPPGGRAARRRRCIRREPSTSRAPWPAPPEQGQVAPCGRPR